MLQPPPQAKPAPPEHRSGCPSTGRRRPLGVAHPPPHVMLPKQTAVGSAAHRFCGSCCLLNLCRGTAAAGVERSRRRSRRRNHCSHRCHGRCCHHCCRCCHLLAFPLLRSQTWPFEGLLISCPPPGGWSRLGGPHCTPSCRCWGQGQGAPWGLRPGSPGVLSPSIGCCCPKVTWCVVPIHRVLLPPGSIEAILALQLGCGDVAWGHGGLGWWPCHGDTVDCGGEVAWDWNMMAWGGEVSWGGSHAHADKVTQAGEVTWSGGHAMETQWPVATR